MSTASLRVPSYRHHKPTDQAVVSLGGRDFYLGRYGTAASRREYKRIVAEWLASDGTAHQTSGELTIVELITYFWRFAKRHYVKNGRPTDEQASIKMALRFVKELYSDTPAAQFGPLALKAVRQKMIEAGWCRNTINSAIGRVRRMFRWAASEEKLPVTAYQALATVQGLQRCRTEAIESKPVQPVSDEVIEATLPKLPQVVADMVRFQRLTGCRPQDVCSIRPCDIDTVEDVWRFRPESHKTEHHGRERIVFIGPKAQDVLSPYLLRAETAYCFAPADSERKRLAGRHESRITPLSCGNRPGTNRRSKPTKVAGLRYTTHSYRRAIARAVAAVNADHQRAFLDGEEPAPVPNWAPNRLRHSAGTELRRRFGLETARVVLGHSDVAATAIYAEADMERAAAVMREVG
jgi:integrase